MRSASDIEIVRGGYEAFNRGDIDWMVEHMDPEIVWEDSAKVPDARTYRGVDEVRRYLESFFRHWDEIRYELGDVRAGSDGIVAVVRLVARGRTTSTPAWLTCMSFATASERGCACTSTARPHSTPQVWSRARVNRAEGPPRLALIRTLR